MFLKGGAKGDFDRSGHSDCPRFLLGLGVASFICLPDAKRTAVHRTIKEIVRPYYAVITMALIQLKRGTILVKCTSVCSLWNLLHEQVVHYITYYSHSS